MPDQTEALVVSEEEGVVVEVDPSPELLEQFVQRYFAMRDTLDRLLENQMVEIQGTMYRCKGFWLAIAQGFKLDLECLKEERYETGDGDFGWIVTYRVTEKRTGRFVDGDGACALSEKHGSMRTEHNVRAHAQTRAKVRAISGMVAFGEVGADEIADDNIPSTLPASAKFVKANSGSAPKKPAPKPKKSAPKKQEEVVSQQEEFNDTSGKTLDDHDGMERIESIKVNRKLDSGGVLYDIKTTRSKYKHIVSKVGDKLQPHQAELLVIVQNAESNQSPIRISYEDKGHWNKLLNCEVIS